MSYTRKLTPLEQSIRQLSERIVNAQRPIRILDAVKWDDAIEADFFKCRCEKLPKISAEYYEQHPLPFDAEQTQQEFHAIIRDINNNLGKYTDISTMMKRQCDEYIHAIEMLKVRGTPQFSELSAELYGAPNDAFYPKGPRLGELGVLLAEIFQPLCKALKTDDDKKCYTAEEAKIILQKKLGKYFQSHDHVTVEISDDIVADASAGSDTIKLNSQVKFSERDIRYLEVHEGWVHIGTTLNGLAQPVCTFLSKGAPSSSITQEGLAVVNEIFTFSSYPRRMLKIANRVRALNLIANGANFIDVYRFFKKQHLNDQRAYQYAVRVFRGSTPNGGPFTKDLSYTKGFILIYNYLRLAVKFGHTNHIPLFFVGKTLIEDIPLIASLKEQGIIDMPHYLPPEFSDLAALSAWMGFSLFLNKFDLDSLAQLTPNIADHTK